MPLEPGTCFGVYRITGPLGAGGMGEVYRARDTRLDRDVAVKVLLSSVAGDPERIARFQREAKVLASLSHPHVAHVYGFEEADGVAALVMELVEGPTLAEFISQRPHPAMSWGAAAELIGEIAETLCVVHEHGIVHRDLKPANIKLGPSGVKILDFGLAKLLRPGDGASDAVTQVDAYTQTGVAVGTVRYMSPEQARCDALDARTDIWSLGVIFYELLTGRSPFDGQTHGHLLVAILEQSPLPIHAVAPDVPPALERIVGRMLAKDAANRYQTAREVADDLRDARTGESLADTTMRVAPIRKMPVWAMVAAVAVLAVGVGTLWSRWHTAPQPEVAAHAINSIAVLPFDNVGGNADEQYLSDGISESVINGLSSLPTVRVVSRGTAFRFRGTDVDPSSAGRRLNVGAVLSGKVRRVDGRLVIDVALTDVANDRQLWGQKYVRGSQDVLATQAEIAHAVANQLSNRVTGADGGRVGQPPTANTSAYDAYLRGRFFENKGDPASLVEAIRLHGEAVSHDPRFALAWAAQARAWVLRGLYFEVPMLMMPRAREAASTALAIDPRQRDAHVILGLVLLMYDWDWAGANRALASSAALGAMAVETFSCTTHLLQAAGRGPDGEREIRAALLTDPLSTLLNTELGCNAYYRRNYDLAIAEYRRTLQIDVGILDAYWGLGRAYGQKREFAKALAELRRVQEIHGTAPPIILGEMGYVAALSGDKATARRTIDTLDRLSGSNWVDPYFTAIVHLALGDREQTMAWLDKAVAVRSSFIASISSDPKWDGMRDFPGFVALLARLKLSPVTLGDVRADS